MTLEQTPEENEDTNNVNVWGESIMEENTAPAGALRSEHAWCGSGIAQKPV
jgi:hypothetical protein